MHTRSRGGACTATLLLGAALAGASIPAHALDAYDTAVLATDPLAYFPLNSVNQGSLINGYTTTFNDSLGVTAPGGGAPIVSDPGNTGAAFSGAQDTSGYSSGPSVSTSLASADPTTASTILAWFNLAALPVSGVDYIAGRSQLDNDLDLQINASDPENVPDELAFYDEANAHVYDATSIVANQWYFVAATEGAAIGGTDMYVNGALVNTIPVSPTSTKTAPFDIGDSPVFPGRNFDGVISNVAFYNRALTPDEISSIYAASFAPNSAAVPEPSSFSLLAVALLPLGALMAKARRRSMA